jgi:serine/threonine-protein kinase
MPILDAADDRSWFVMPLALGNLEDLWSKATLGNDAEVVAAGILDAVTQGLEPAHELGYVRRDISPRNVLALPDSINPSGRRWVVADWGIVKRPAGDTTHRYTRTGEGLGTAGFASPETWQDAHRVGFYAERTVDDTVLPRVMFTSR